MVSIYCIEDINGLKYIGSSTQQLNLRLGQHRYDRKRNKFLSSKQLDLDNCKIYELEKCEKKISYDREKYWINKIKCVNKYKFNFSNELYERTRRKEKEMKDRRNKQKNLAYHYKASWGGNPLRNNNLLDIDITIFN